MSTLLSFLGQNGLLVWPLGVEILYGRPCSAWNRHPDPTGGQLLDQFENFQHTTLLFEIVAGFQCHPLGVQIAFPRVTCDGALRMAAHLPDAGCATAATAVGAGRVGAAAGHPVWAFTLGPGATAVGAGRGVGGSAVMLMPRDS